MSKNIISICKHVSCLTNVQKEVIVPPRKPRYMVEWEMVIKCLRLIQM